jgi:hypothetical protein
MKAIRIAAIGLASVLFLGVAALTIAAPCSPTNSASLDFLDGSFFRSRDGVFIYSVDASWSTKGTPFIGVMRTASGTIGVQDVQYIPAYWFPSDCNGKQRVVVVGRETGPAPHMVNTENRYGPTPNHAVALLPIANP